MERMQAKQHMKKKTSEEKKTKRAEGVECGEKPIKKQKQTRKKEMEKSKLIDEGIEEIEIEDDDAHLGMCKHCEDYLLSQTNTQTCALLVGADGECRILMVSQYGDTPSPLGTSDDDFELVKLNLLDNLFSEFEICVNKINNTLTESCLMLPESDLLKQKAMEWKEIMKKQLVIDDEEKRREMKWKRLIKTLKLQRMMWLK
ncbi:hypothetical protein Hanom_Chr01g00053221 [Helianthus anomalus]